MGSRRGMTALCCAALVAAASCTSDSTDRAEGPSAPPIDVEALTGRIVLTADDDIYSANADGTGARGLTTGAGPEIDAAWAPDGSRIVYRDSQRGFNNDDEIFVVSADGTGATNLTNHPANDWGPDWSPDGRTIVFNSDRDGLPMGGYLINPDGTDLRRIPTDSWVEYPAWSPDGARIAFMGGPSASNYDIWIVDIDGTDLVQLTDAPGQDGWPAWSPDGTRIAFTSVRDDCRFSDAADCRPSDAEEDDPHRDVWVVDPDGTDPTRVSPEYGQFVTWSPDGLYLLVYGRELYVIRADGTGRAALDVAGLAGGMFPDWVE